MELTLNKSQTEATLHNKGPMMVLSGPGSGKTTVITYRIKNLIENLGVLPKDILVITFTKAASEEMKERFNSICDYSYNVSFGTFHSYFFRIIREYYKYDLANVLDDNEKIDIIRKILLENEISSDNYEELVQDIISEISLVKNEIINPIYYNSKCINSSSFTDIYNEYEQIKTQNKKIDFDDMLVICYNTIKKDAQLRQFWKNKYKYVLIDEFQDINRVQYECIKMLVPKDDNIFVVGDDDQSIYGFRGSRPEFLLSFHKDFSYAKKVVLNVNYRSTNQIINLCNNIIDDNKNRYKKNIIGTDKSFKPPVLIRAYDTYEEGKKIIEKIQILKKTYPLDEIAIIYRTNLQTRAIVEKLIDYNIEYQLKDKIPSIYDHFIAKDIIAYIKLSIDKSDNESFVRIANKPKRFLSKDIISNAVNICKDKESALEYLYCKADLKSWQLENINNLLFHLGKIKGKSSYDAIRYIFNNVGYEDYLEDYANFKNIGIKGLLEISNEILESSKGYDNLENFLDYLNNIKNEIIKKDKNNQKGVVLTTMHSAKGLEFDVVFVIGCIDGVIPHEKSKTYEEIEEERRLFYVALTRAKKLLYISILKTKYDNNVIPSRFLNKLIKIKR
ncbi:ATP-dependent helicase [[Clostridium] colinum]|uniref:ATP-dependent helicase n=1 Tax=[Clostridium] colinum TaxID=36835 RepID=UPI0020249CDE|nr:ATP-dependent helicase [[Clostridium] colinum]